MEASIRYISSLKSGLTARQVSEQEKVGYSTICRHLREIGYDGKGNPKLRAPLTKRMRALYKLVLNQSKTLEDAATLLNASKAHVSRTMARMELTKKWNLEANPDQTTAAGRIAELFVKRMHPRWLVRDCYMSKKGSKQFPYDLILSGQLDVIINEEPFAGGSVDVKHAALKVEQRKGYRRPIAGWGFSVSNFTKRVKWAALVGFNEDKSEIIAVYMVPGKMVYGHSTIRVNQGRSKYNAYKIWSKENACTE